MVLSGHISELNRALHDVPQSHDENCPEMARAGMARLPGTPLAQILSYTPFRHFHTITAVHPLARLYAELYIRPTNNARAVGQAFIDTKCLCYRIQTEGRGGADLEKLQCSLWWAELCGLPLVLEIYSTDLAVVEAFSDTLRQRVVKLHLRITTVDSAVGRNSSSYGEEATEHPTSLPSTDDSCTAQQGERDAEAVDEELQPTVVDALPTLPRLHDIYIDCYCDAPNGRRAHTLVARVMRWVASSSSNAAVHHVKLSRCRFLTQSLLAESSPHLRRLEVVSSKVRRIGDLSSCEELEEIEFNFCDRLPSLVELSAAPHLRKVTAFLCGLKTVEGLCACPALVELDVSHNPTLTSLDALSGARHLRKLTAIKCQLRSIAGLQRCDALCRVDLSYNRNLQTLSGLAAAPSLATLRAVKCGLRTLDGLNACPVLADVDISNNRELGSLAGLAGAPGLERLQATECNLTDLASLHTCPLLARVDLSHNHALRSLAALSGSRRLVKVRAVQCGLAEVSGLSACPLLAEVHVSYNTALQSVAGLAGAPRLQEVHVQGTSVGDVNVLSACPKLVRVVTTNDRNLRGADLLPHVDVVLRSRWSSVRVEEVQNGV